MNLSVISSNFFLDEIYISYIFIIYDFFSLIHYLALYLTLCLTVNFNYLFNSFFFSYLIVYALAIF